MAKVVPLFSGSKGNSYYIGTGNSGILIDAGRNCKQLEIALHDNEISIRNIQAIFVTHEHTDHCSALRVFCKRYNIPVYASAGTLSALSAGNKLAPDCQAKVIDREVALPNMLIKRYNTSHDASESCGYQVEMSSGKVMLATDMGIMSSEIRGAISNSDVAIIESNHDVNMLKNGFYPYELKRRILSDVGHLSNEDCSKELANFVKNNTTRFILSHLSEENNTPNLAYQTAICELQLQKMWLDVDYTLTIAPTVTDGKCVVF